MRVGISERVVQVASAAAAVVLAVVLAARSVWPFDGSRPRLPVRPSLWQLLLSDQVTLGFIRLAFVMLAIFVIASVPALVTGGRWLKSFGAGGLVADDAAGLHGALEVAEQQLERATRDLEAAKKERDEAVALAAGRPR